MYTPVYGNSALHRHSKDTLLPLRQGKGTIPTFAMSNLSRLRQFACEKCNIRYIADMPHLASLKSLIIPNNALVAIPDLFHVPLSRITWVGNPIECNMSLCWVRMWGHVKPSTLTLDSMTCESPSEVAGLKVTDIHPVAMKCYAGRPYRRILLRGSRFVVFVLIIIGHFYPYFDILHMHWGNHTIAEVSVKTTLQRMRRPKLIMQIIRVVWNGRMKTKYQKLCACLKQDASTYIHVNTGVQLLISSLISMVRSS